MKNNFSFPPELDYNFLFFYNTFTVLCFTVENASSSYLLPVLFSFYRSTDTRLREQAHHAQQPILERRKNTPDCRVLARTKCNRRIFTATPPAFFRYIIGQENVV